jgi:DNA repair ATPase RecN
VNPLLLPPRLLLRALDDLHTIAQAAARLEDVERRLDARLAAVLELGDRIEQLGELVDGRIGQVDRRAGELLEVAERVDGRLDGLLGVAGRIDAVLEQGRRIEDVAAQVAERGGQIADAMPVLQRAVEMAVPLEGAVERLGRIVDRLPQVPQRRTRPAASKPT